jgi:simple sugar transport system permease protein
MNFNMQKIKDTIFREKTTLLFIVLSIFGVIAAQQPLSFVLGELATRFGRNAFLVLALLIPVMAGMGLNFAMVIGAMAAQISVFIVILLEIQGILGVIVAMMLSAPLAGLFGLLVGKLFNNMKGSEMIGGMVLGFFADGLYQFLFLFILGGVIPINRPEIMITSGIGVRGTLELSGTIRYALDNLWRMDALNLVTIGVALFVLYNIFVLVRKHRSDLRAPQARKLIVRIVGAGVVYALTYVPYVTRLLIGIRVPVVTWMMIFLLCVFLTAFTKTKLGQNMRAVGQNRNIARASGIDVDKTRIIAMMMSTVFAGWGQIILLQNLGTFSTYGAHTQVGQFAIASLLVGGASVQKASIKHALLGVILFHTLFIVSPIAGKNLLDNAQLGEYFRVFISYGVIAMSLALHAWQKAPKKKEQAKAEAAA